MKWIQELKQLIAHWQTETIAYIPNLVLSLIIVLVFYFLAKIFRQISARFFSETLKNKGRIVDLISISVYLFFILSGIFLALEALHLEGFLSKLLASAGIVGIIAGFAFKDIVSNAFSGLLIKSLHPFAIGDWVEIDGNFGTVQEITMITTRIKNISGQIVFVPNQVVYNTIFVNYSMLKKRLVVMKSGVSYGDDLEKVEKVTLDEVKKIESILPNEPIDFFYTDIGSSTYNFEVRFWINFTQQKEYKKAMSECIIRLKKRYETEDISIAYNVTTLDFGVKGGVNIFDKALKK